MATIVRGLNRVIYKSGWRETSERQLIGDSYCIYWCFYLTVYACKILQNENENENEKKGRKDMM